MKSENNNLKQELIMLKIDKDLNKFGNEQNKQNEHNDGDESSQQALLSDKGTPNTFTDPQLAFVNKLLPPKWFTKVKIVVSPDYHFTVIAMIDSSANMNCIQEG